MNEDSKLEENALNGDFPELPKRSPPKTQTHIKNPLFLKNANLLPKQKAAAGLFSEINADISVSKISFYSSGNIKTLPKKISDHNLINNHAFSNAIYRITKNHITIEEPTLSFPNYIPCLNKISFSTTLEDIEEALYKKTFQ